MSDNSIIYAMKKQFAVLAVILIPAIFSCGQAKTIQPKTGQQTDSDTSKIPKSGLFTNPKTPIARKITPKIVNIFFCIRLKLSWITMKPTPCIDLAHSFTIKKRK